MWVCGHVWVLEGLAWFLRDGTVQNGISPFLVWASGGLGSCGPVVGHSAPEPPAHGKGGLVSDRGPQTHSGEGLLPIQGDRRLNVRVRVSIK